MNSPFAPRLVVALIAAGAAAFALMLIGFAYGGAGGSRSDGRTHSLSVSATGYRGLVTLVGSRFETRLVSRPDQLQDENLLVVALEPNSSAASLDALLARRHGLATVIVLPKWLTAPDPERHGWVRAIAPSAGAMIGPVVGKGIEVEVLRAFGPTNAAGEDFLSGLTLPVPDSPQIVRGGAVSPLVPLGGGALVGRLGDQPHYVVADPDLLNNHGLRDLDSARAAVALMTELTPTGSTRVDFDLTMNGFGQGSGASLLRLTFEPPFAAMTLALVIAALLAGLHGAFRFGPMATPERAIPLGKAALVENSAGLIRLAGREARLGPAFVAMIRAEAGRTARAPHGLSETELDRQLDRLSRSNGPCFSELARSVIAARGHHALVAAAASLFRWKKDMIR